MFFASAFCLQMQASEGCCTGGDIRGMKETFAVSFVGQIRESLTKYSAGIPGRANSDLV